MGVRQSVFTRATSGHAGLSALIGTRCYPDRLPENVTLPAVRYQVVSLPPHSYQDHDGASPDRTRSRIQMDGFDVSSDKAEALQKQMFLAFEGWSSGTAVGWSFVANRLGDYDTSLNRHRVIVEIVIDHKV